MSRANQTSPSRGATGGSPRSSPTSASQNTRSSSSQPTPEEDERRQKLIAKYNQLNDELDGMKDERAQMDTEKEGLKKAIAEAKAREDELTAQLNALTGGSPPSSV
jgi:chromosome segregation ATPase